MTTLTRQQGRRPGGLTWKAAVIHCLSSLAVTRVFAMSFLTEIKRRRLLAVGCQERISEERVWRRRRISWGTKTNLQCYHLLWATIQHRGVVSPQDCRLQRTWLRILRPQCPVNISDEGPSRRSSSAPSPDQGHVRWLGHVLRQTDDHPTRVICKLTTTLRQTTHPLERCCPPGPPAY